jgi:hypothetical protein
MPRLRLRQRLCVAVIMRVRQALRGYKAYRRNIFVEVGLLARFARPKLLIALREDGR